MKVAAASSLNPKIKPIQKSDKKDYSDKLNYLEKLNYSHGKHKDSLLAPKTIH